MPSPSQPDSSGVSTCFYANFVTLGVATKKKDKGWWKQFIRRGDDIVCALALFHDDKHGGEQKYILDYVWTDEETHFHAFNL